jgi:glutathione S-transferase
MKLYDLELSGNCYKVRLLAAMLGVPLDIQPVDFMAGEHKSPAFLARNPFGEIPVLDDDGVVLRDSQAIVVYLARKFGGEAWLPSGARELAQVMQWVSTAANDVARGPNDARLHDLFGYKLDVGRARAQATRLLGVLEAHLAGRSWLELGRPTVADVTVYPYVALAEQGGVALAPYPAVRAWMARMQKLPGYVPMPGQFAAA